MNDRGPVFKENILTENNNVIELKKPEKPALALIGGTDGTDENWLGAMEVGTGFLSREKGSDIKNPFLNLYEIGYKAGDYSLLFVKMPDGQSASPWVDNLRFSRRMELVQVLGIAREQENKDAGETVQRTSDQRSEDTIS